MSSSSWHSYPKIYNIGHPAVASLFFDDVTVEEKVDGSQFSFGMIDGQLRVRSRGQEMQVDAPEKLFTEAVEVVKELAPKLCAGYTYRAEYLKKPKHNVLAYGRIPDKHLIVFDINVGEEWYMEYDFKKAEAARLGLECVPRIYSGKIETAEQVKTLLDRTSVLGGQKVEGVVVKNYARFGKDGKALMGKFVSEEFKEIHGGEWRKENPTKADVIDELVCRYKTPARWNKAVQHLAEAGKLTSSPKDIGALIKEVQADVEAECGPEIREALYAYAKDKIVRGVIAGLPQWYKEKLLSDSFLPK